MKLPVPTALWVGHSTDRARLWLQKGRLRVKVTPILAGALRGSSEASRQGFCPGAAFGWEETDSRHAHPIGGAYRVAEATLREGEGGRAMLWYIWVARNGFLDGVVHEQALRKRGSQPYR